MADFSDFTEAAGAVIDPRTTAAELAQIAELQPGLWAQVAGHPAAYPDLLQWLDEVGDTSVKDALAARHDSKARQRVPVEPVEEVDDDPIPDEPAITVDSKPSRPPASRPAKPKSFWASRNGRFAMYGGGALVLIVAVALIVVFAVSRPMDTAKTAFDSAVNAYQQAQTDLASEVTVAQTVAQGVNTDQISDATTLDALNSQITAAQTASTVVAPTMASSRAVIEQQTATLLSDTQSLATQKQTLTDAVTLVKANQIAWAKDTLTAAVSAAKDVLTQYSYSTDTKSMTGLQDQITTAQTMLDGIDQADASAVGDNVAKMVQSLSDAQQAVINAAPTKCGTITVPKGVDARVCKGMPAKAITTSVIVGDSLTLNMFQMPSGNMGCSDGYGPVTCEIKSFSWKMPTALITACQATNTSDVTCSTGDISLTDTVELLVHEDQGPWAAAMAAKIKVPILQYGQVANLDTVACLSASDGVTCWNTSSHHGFKMSKVLFLYW